MKVSACIVTKDEEKNLPVLMEQLKGRVDEIIIIDGGSNDHTVQIAYNYTPHVYFGYGQGPDRDRYLYLEKARNDWVLCLDADERISPCLLDNLDTLTSLPCNGFWVPRRNYYNADRYYKYIHYPDLQLRLYRRDKCIKINDRVHSSPMITGAVVKLGEPYFIVHLDPIYSDHRKYMGYAKMHARELLDGKNRLYCRLIAPYKFLESLYCDILSGCFLDGGPGLGAAFDRALYNFMVYMSV